jgi:Family of unknown function (DUF5677)
MSFQEGHSKHEATFDHQEILASSAEILIANLAARREVEFGAETKRRKVHYSARLEKWRVGFDFCDLSLQLTRSATRLFYKQALLIPSLRLNAKSIHIGVIQKKIIELAEEVSLLMRHGYLSGAQSRARTIYETSIIMRFLAASDDETTYRYLDHSTVKAFEDAAARLVVERNDIESPQCASEYRQLKVKYEKLITKYGEEFKGGYGWARTALLRNLPDHKGRITFAHIEAVVGGAHFNQLFRIASHSVHMTPMTFKTEYLSQPLLKKRGLIGFSIPFHLSLTSLLASLSSLTMVLELLPSIADGELREIEDLYFEMRVHIAAFNIIYEKAIKTVLLIEKSDLPVAASGRGAEEK